MAKNEAAVALGRVGGKRSAESRFKNKTPEEISEAMKKVRSKANKVTK